MSSDEACRLLWADGKPFVSPITKKVLEPLWYDNVAVRGLVSGLKEFLGL
jgi:hypothetical protein